MRPGTPQDIHVDDPALEGGEWLFKRDGQVFGPVDSRALAAMLYRGDLDGRTPVSPDGGAWRPVAEVPLFAVHARKAEAAIRVEREVTGARRIERRKGRVKAAAAVVAALVVVGGAIGGAYLAASRRDAPSPLLEDFGQGIRIASAARVGAGHHAPSAEEEFEVAFDPARPAAPKRAAPSRPPAPAPGAGPGAASGEVDGGELAAAQWDEGAIQSVVAREQRTLAPCFRAEARRSPGFAGDIPIEFAIGNDGRVADLWIEEPRFRQGELRTCLLQALRGWRFPPYPGQRATVSLAFRIGS